MHDTDPGPGRPDTGECLPYYVQYIKLVPAFVASLRGLDAAAWERRAPEDWTIRSVRAVAYTMAGHERHHLADIRRQHGG